MGERLQEPGQGNDTRSEAGGDDDGSGLEWFADAPFIQELATRLKRSLRISRILGTLAGVALILLVAALLFVLRMGWEAARTASVESSLILSGMTMPDGPLPNQKRAPCIGIHAIAFRGGCWASYAKSEPTESCGPDFYNAPPEATGVHKDLCYLPVEIVPPSRRSVGK